MTTVYKILETTKHGFKTMFLARKCCYKRTRFVDNDTYVHKGAIPVQSLWCRGKNIQGGPGRFHPQNTDPWNFQNRAPEIFHRLQCQKLSNICRFRQWDVKSTCSPEND